MRKFLLSLFLVPFFLVKGQDTFPINGVADERLEIYAFTNAKIYLDFQTVLEQATLIIDHDKVVTVGTDFAIPKGAIVIDLKGKYIYPALIDPYTNYGVSFFEIAAGATAKPQYDSERNEAYGWNDNIKADFDADAVFVLDKTDALEWKKLGFGAVNSFRKAGLVRGTSVFTSLATQSVNESIIKGQAASHFSFTKGHTKQLYPKSIMGSVALIRQTYYDADWYQTSLNLEYNLTLESFNESRALPQIFEASGDKLRVLLADKVGDEFGVQYIIKGNGDEYQRADEIKATNASLILPLEFPAAYDVSDPIAAMDVSLAEMKHWEMAPSNAKILADQGVDFAFTTYGLKDKSSLWATLKTVSETGLPKSQILKSLTYSPAKMFGLENEVGALKKGMIASFIITSGDLFEKETKILETWVQGERNQFGELDQADYAGVYQLKMDTTSFKLELIKIETGHSAVIYKKDSTILAVDLQVKENNVLLSFTKDSINYRLTGWIGNDRFGGVGTDEKGGDFSWKAAKDEPKDTVVEKSESVKKTELKPDEKGKMIYPFVAHGWTEKPNQETILFKNATVWTLSGDDKLEDADVLVENGKIANVGSGLTAPNAKIIDAKGKHLTPGIIDEHSHLGLSAVNEGSVAVVAEVRMADAVNSEDINIYRNLAGGVTVAQLLHGSANPVGGQSAIIKFRWGAAPSELLIKDADPFIKFALGENVKQSNWGDQNTIRFPQTRMGVEQVYIESFTRAREYGLAKAKYETLSKKVKASTPAPRTDLRMEALLEIINKERYITCHSYVQSEINMLMKVAEQFDFRVNTFTHILEGYKVSDKMAKHGVGASTFSDWWAYKFEVKEAIPYNAALMQDAGLTVAINSDNAEMARRLNQEAAKSVKYGGMSEVDALKMVTINPAKLLHLDDQMGSIEVGKDADLVLWSNHPLSIYARPEYTLVDGTIYFSLEKEKEAQAYILAERTRLINKMIQAKAGGAPTQPPMKVEEELLHCDSEEHSITQTENEHE
jgi:imidazolonepropionase-like amidohydrolase